MHRCCNSHKHSSQHVTVCMWKYKLTFNTMNIITLNLCDMFQSPAWQFQPLICSHKIKCWFIRTIICYCILKCCNISELVCKHIIHVYKQCINGFWTLLTLNSEVLWTFLSFSELFLNFFWTFMNWNSELFWTFLNSIKIAFSLYFTMFLKFRKVQKSS